jgi:hypothetical protein
MSPCLLRMCSSLILAVLFRGVVVVSWLTSGTVPETLSPTALVAVRRRDGEIHVPARGASTDPRAKGPSIQIRKVLMEASLHLRGGGDRWVTGNDYPPPPPSEVLRFESFSFAAFIHASKCHFSNTSSWINPKIKLYTLKGCVLWKSIG